MAGVPWALEAGLSVWSLVSVRLDDYMDNRVCVARPKIERLSAGMEQEAVTLLAVLIADAAQKDDAQPGGIPAANSLSNSSSNTPSITSSN
jgi:hypothetical protein